MKGGCPLSCLYPPFTKTFKNLAMSNGSRRPDVPINSGSSYQPISSPSSTPWGVGRLASDFDTSRFDAHGLSQYATDINRLRPSQIAFLDALDQYKGSEYYRQLLAYAPAAFQSYNSTGAQDLFSRLGFRTAEDDFYLDQDSYINDVLSQIAGVKREEAHNSVAAQKQQNELAGINTDLSGISNSDAGKASEFNEVPRQLAPQDNVNEAILSFGQALVAAPTQFVSGIVDIVSMFQGLHGVGLDNGLKSLKLEEGADEWIVKTLAGTQPIWKKNAKGEEVIGDIDTGATSQALSEALFSIPVDEIPNKFFRKAVRRAKQRYGSNEGKRTVAVQRALAMMQKDYAGSMSDVAQILGDPKFSDDFGKMVSNFATFYDNTTQKYIDFQNKMYELQVEYQEYANNYQEAESKYHNEQIAELVAKHIPAKEAAYQAWSLKSQEEYEKFMSEQNQSWSDMMEKIPGNGTLSAIARILLGGLRTILMDKLSVAPFSPRMSSSPAPTNVNINNMSKPESMPSQYQAVAGYDW